MEEFILSGTIYDEYYQEIDPKEFLEMAYNWCPDGLIVNEEYYEKEFDQKGRPRPFFSGPDYYDEEHFGLRFCNTTEFS